MGGIKHSVMRYALRGYSPTQPNKAGVPTLVRFGALNVRTGERAGLVAVFSDTTKAKAALQAGLRRKYKDVEVVLVNITVTLANHL